MLAQLKNIPMPNRYLTECKKALFWKYNNSIPFSDYERDELLPALISLERRKRWANTK